MNKYKLILLKDLPRHKVGTEVINISEEELNGTKDYKYRYWADEYNFSDIYDLRHDSDWVRIEKDLRCDCLTKEEISLVDSVIGYGRNLSTYIDFKNKRIVTHYDSGCEQGKSYVLNIDYCPLCGRMLNCSEVNENDNYC